jgi:4-pyridoxolactonase
VYGVLVDHKDGKFLFDTGFDKSFIESLLPGNAIQTDRQTVPGQLDLVGLRPSDITHVVNSHYHVDHVGGNKHCMQATAVCHKRELEAASNPLPFEKRGYSDLSFAPQLQPDNDPTAYGTEIHIPKIETLTGDQEIAKGVFLFETPGHTPGHYSLMVKLSGRRPMLFSGDACYTHRSMEENVISGTHSDVKQTFDSMEKLRDLAATHDAELFYSHDAQAWQGWRPAPGFYA